MTSTPASENTVRSTAKHLRKYLAAAGQNALLFLSKQSTLVVQIMGSTSKPRLGESSYYGAILNLSCDSSLLIVFLRWDYQRWSALTLRCTTSIVWCFHATEQLTNQSKDVASTSRHSEQPLVLFLRRLAPSVVISRAVDSRSTGSVVFRF